jgi:hypothetical protein
MIITTRRITQIGIVSLIAAGLAACTQTASTVVCWQEPIAQPRRDAVYTDKYDPLPAMQTICAPVSARLPGQPPVPGGPGTTAVPVPGPGPGPIPGPTPTPSTRDSSAQTYRDTDGNNLGTIAVGEPVAGRTPVAGTDRREDAPRTYAGTLDAIITGDAIREEVAGLGGAIRSGVADATRGAGVE